MANHRTLRRSLVVTVFVAFSLLLFSLGAFAFHDFSDVDSAAFYHDDVNWLKEMGITLGCGGTLFCPNDPVTRGQMAAFLHRASRVHETPGFSLSIVDTGFLGQYTATTIGVDGRPLISYYDVTNGDLKVAHCNDTACTAAAVATVDTTGDVGNYTSITIGADGLGLISYNDNTNGDLKVAHCNDNLCSASTLSTLDSAGNVGVFTSITIGADGLGLISYYDNTNADLKVAHCSNATCSAATLATLDSATTVGLATSIAIGADGLGLISYFDQTLQQLKVAHCVDLACTTATLVSLDFLIGYGAFSTSMTIGADGVGLISYYNQLNGDLKVVHCSNTFCVPYHRGR